MAEKIFSHLQDIKPVATAHGTGKKFVFLNNGDAKAAITQFAYGELLSGEKCPSHMHPTMEECFYFISGKGVYKVGEIVYNIVPGTFLRIPSGIMHEVYASEKLTFAYFGVATE